MSHRSHTLAHITTFIKFVETQFSLKVKILRSDNGPKSTMGEFYLDEGIIHQTSCIYATTKWSDREKTSSVSQRSPSLIIPSQPFVEILGDSILTATYLINWTSTPLFRGKTPYEMPYHKQHSYDHLRVFGCLCFALT